MVHHKERAACLGGARDGIRGELAGSLEHVLDRLDDRARQGVRVEVHHRRDEVCLANHLQATKI